MEPRPRKRAEKDGAKSQEASRERWSQVLGSEQRKMEPSPRKPAEKDGAKF